LAVCGDRASDVSPKQASYHYVQIDSEVVVRHGYLVLKVSDELLRQAESITRQQHRAAVFQWREGQWWELPTQTHDYALPSSGPTFNPSSLRLVEAESGEKVALIPGITVEKSQ